MTRKQALALMYAINGDYRLVAHGIWRAVSLFPLCAGGFGLVLRDTWINVNYCVCDAAGVQRLTKVAA